MSLPKQILSILVLLLSYCPFTTSAQGGTEPYSFLNIPSSARAYAMGGANFSFLDSSDPALAMQNPALLGAESDKTVSLSYMHYMGSSNFASALFSKSTGIHGAWAAGLRYLNYGSFEGADIDGSPTGSFTPQDIVASGIYTHDITERLRGGVSLRFVYSTYESYTAIALAADLGINYYDEEHDTSLSAVLRNMGGQVKRFDSRYQRLPFNICLGWSQGIGRTPLTLSISANNLVRWRLPYYDRDEESETIELKQNFVSNLFRHLIFALDVSPSAHFHATLAYNYKTRTDMATYHRNFLSGFSIGAGFNVKSFAVDAAFAQPHRGAASLMLTLSCNLNELLR